MPVVGVEGKETNSLFLFSHADISNYPSSAAEMRDVLLLKIAVLSGELLPDLCLR